MSSLDKPFVQESLRPGAKLQYEMFHPQIIALNREVAMHPELCKIIANQPQKDVYIRILEIATYCNVIMVAELYTLEDILDMCEKLTAELFKKRTSIIIPFK